MKHRLTETGERLRTEGQAAADGVLEESFRGLDGGELEALDGLLAKALRAPLAPDRALPPNLGGERSGRRLPA